MPPIVAVVLVSVQCFLNTGASMGKEKVLFLRNYQVVVWSAQEGFRFLPDSNNIYARPLGEKRAFSISQKPHLLRYVSSCITRVI